MLAVLGAALASLLTFDIISRGELEMEQSDRSFHGGDLVASLAHARRAAALYVPGAPHVKAARDRLIAIAQGSESTGRTDIARRAWGAVRSCALETQPFGSRQDLQRAGSRLAVLTAASKDGRSSRPGMSQPGSLEVLPGPVGPRWPWTAVLVAGLLTTVAGLAVMARSGTDSAGHLRWRPAGWALALFVVGVACWTLAMVGA
jgi:hypothetical protein